MKLTSIILLLIFTHSCIPLRIAPNIKGDKIMVAKKFKKSLPKQYSLIFNDSKDANEFYNYINTKFELNHNNVAYNVPFTLNDEKFFFSFYETEVSTKSINLVPIATDMVLESKGITPILKESEFTRVGNWYIVLTASDINNEDCLNLNHKSRVKVLKYLRELRVEYLNTTNYLETLFTK